MRIRGTQSLAMAWLSLILVMTGFGAADAGAKHETGCFPTPPSRADYSTESIIASGQRGGDLVPTASNFTYQHNREMGEAMELWNAHHWEEGVARLRRIYERHPESPWAAEAELHVACYCKFNAQYDEAEERFLSVFKRHPGNKHIQRKVLYYLPHLYAATGRSRAAQDVLNMMREYPLDWRERQFYENWARILHGMVVADDENRLCATKAAALALEAIHQRDHCPLINVSLAEIYSKRSWVARVSDHPDGYSLQELADLTGGQPRALTFDELTRLADPARPVVAFLAAPAEPKVYQALARPFPKDYRRPSGHFVTVESANDQIVQVLDPTGGRGRWPATDFKYRWSGFVLLLARGGATIGRSVPEQRAGELRGGCCGCPPPGTSGGGCNSASSGAGSLNGSGLGVDGPGGGSFACAMCGRAHKGSPVYQFGLPSANLVLADTPMWYPAALGPGMSIELAYNRVETQNLASNQTANYFCFGNKWSFNFSTFMKETPAGDGQVVVPGGDMLEYDSTNGGYVAQDIRNQSELSLTGGYNVLTFEGSKGQWFFSTNSSESTGQQVERMRDRYGNEINCQYDASGRLTNVVDAIGRYFSLSYDASGFVTNIADLLGRKCSFGYSSNGNLVCMTDMGGYTTTLGYNTNNWVTNIVYPSGSSVTFDYANGQQIGSFYASYGAAGYPAFRIRAVDSLGYTNEYFYHAADSYGPASVKDASGNAWLYANEGVQNPDRHKAIFYEGVNDYAYDYEGSYFSHHFSHRAFDASRNLIQATFPTSPVPGTYKTPPVPITNGVVRKYAYDTNHWLVGETWILSEAAYATWSNQYDNSGNRIWRRDPLGAETKYGYDSNDNLLAVTNALGFVTAMAYDGNGDMTNLVDANGNATRWTYNANGWNTAIVNADGSTHSQTYDSIGRMVSVRNPAGFETTNTYDDLDRVTQVSYPGGTAYQYDYSCCGLEEVVDRLGNSTRYSNDALGRVTAMINALNKPVLFRYDPLGNITNLVVPTSSFPDNTVVFKYTSTNGFTRLTSRISPLGKTNSYSYTFRGWLASRTDGEGRATTNYYDAFGRLTRIAYGTGTNVDFSYDLLGRVVSTGARSGTNAFSYDLLGFVTNKTVAYCVPGFSNVSYQLEFKYDPVGNVTERVLRGTSGFTNEIREKYAYDSMNRLVSVSNDLADAGYSYDSAGRLSAKTCGNGDVARHSYDLESRLTSLAISNGTASIANWQYSYNDMGMVLAITSAASSAQYTYDAIYQLTGESYSAGTNSQIASWVYDEMGNRLSRAQEGQTNIYQYDADNELTWMSVSTADAVTVSGSVEPGPSSNKWYNTWAQANGQWARVSTNDGSFEISQVPVQQGSNAMTVTVTDVSGNTSTQIVGFTKQTLVSSTFFTYDDNGNMVSDTKWSGGQTATNVFSYDMENRLTGVTSNGMTVLECWYDATGRRIAKREVVGGQTNSAMYVYDGWNILAAVNQNGEMIEYYTRGNGIAGDIGTIVAETKFTNGAAIATYYYHCNHRGDVTHVRSGTNTIATYDYAPFGELRSSSGSYNARFRFSSKECDQASGLYYFGFRYCGPTVGRFVTADPLGEKLGLNLYRFCANNPLRYVDTDGRSVAAVDCYAGICSRGVPNPDVGNGPGPDDIANWILGGATAVAAAQCIQLHIAWEDCNAGLMECPPTRKAADCKKLRDAELKCWQIVNGTAEGQL